MASSAAACVADGDGPVSGNGPISGGGGAVWARERAASASLRDGSPAEGVAAAPAARTPRR